MSAVPSPSARSLPSISEMTGYYRPIVPDVMREECHGLKQRKGQNRLDYRKEETTLVERKPYCV